MYAIRSYYDDENRTFAKGSFGKITFKNSDGKEYFTLTKDTGYAPVEQTVYATPRTGSNEGDRMALIVYGGMFHVQTGYIYEWREI